MVKQKSAGGCCSKLCSHVSIFFLVAVNFGIGLVGVMLIGLGAYMFANFAEFEDLISQQAIIYVLCTGLILFLLAIVAIIGALNRMKKLLSVYVLILLLLVVGEVIVVIVTLEYLGVVSDAADVDDVGSNSEEALNGREQIISNFLLRTYRTCCFLDDEFCPIVENNCTDVFTCQENIAGVCVVDDNIGDVDPAVCTGIENLDSTIIDPLPDGCGGGDPAEFLEQVGDFFVDRVQLIAIFLGVLGFVEILMIVFTMFLIFGKRVDYDRTMPWDDVEDAAVVPVAVSEAEMNRLSARGVNRPGEGRRTSANRMSARLSQQRRSVGARGATADFSSSIDDDPAPPVQAPTARGRVASFGTALSVTKKQMVENPDVIEDVI